MIVHPYKIPFSIIQTTLPSMEHKKILWNIFLCFFFLSLKHSLKYILFIWLNNLSFFYYLFPKHTLFLTIVQFVGLFWSLCKYMLYTAPNFIIWILYWWDLEREIWQQFSMCLHFFRYKRKTYICGYIKLESLIITVEWKCMNSKTFISPFWIPLWGFFVIVGVLSDPRYQFT